MKAVTPPESGVDPFQALVPAATDEVADLREQVAALTRLQEAIHFLGGQTDLKALPGEVLDLALSVSGLARGMVAVRRRGRSGPGSSVAGSGAESQAEGSTEQSAEQSTEQTASRARFKVAARRGFEREVRGSREERVLYGILGRALERQDGLIEGCIRSQGILGHAADARSLELGAVACLPLVSDGEVLGALLLDDPRRRTPFSTAEESLLRSFARHAALSLARVVERRKLKRRAHRAARRADRLEGEVRALAERRIDAPQRACSGRLVGQEPSAESGASRAGRELARLLSLPYAEAKRDFTRRLLIEAMSEADGDLRRASARTGLPVARLIGLIEALELRGSDLRRRPAARPERREARETGWGQAVRDPAGLD